MEENSNSGEKINNDLPILQGSQPNSSTSSKKGGFLKIGLLIIGIIVTVSIGIYALLVPPPAAEPKEESSGQKGGQLDNATDLICPTGYYKDNSSAKKINLTPGIVTAKNLNITQEGGAIKNTNTTQKAGTTKIKRNKTPSSPQPALSQTPSPPSQSSTASPPQTPPSPSQTQPAASPSQPVLNTAPVAQTVPTCKPVPQDNLNSGSQECFLINQLYDQPDNFSMDDQTKVTVRDGYKACNPLTKLPATSCDINQITDAGGDCVCKKNYKLNTKLNACVYDCGAAQQNLLDLQKDHNSKTSPEIAQELKIWQTEALVNGCSLPDSGANEKLCTGYQAEANNALLEKRYLAYFEANKNFIDSNCSGKTENVCTNLLVEAKIVRDIAPKLTDSIQIEKLNFYYNKLRDSYYVNPACNVVKDRCTKLNPLYGNQLGNQLGLPTIPTQVNPTPAGPTPVNPTPGGGNENSNGNDAWESGTSFSDFKNLDPGAIFKDDQQYFSTFCVCDNLFTKYSDTDVSNAEIPEVDKLKLNNCKSIRQKLQESATGE